MQFRNALRAIVWVIFCCAWAAETPAAVLHQFTTTDAALNPDDGYDPSVVTVTTGPNVVAPANGAQLGAGNTGLNRFWNTEWAGFSLSSPNGAAIDSAAEFNTGYFTWTVSAAPGYQLDLTSLDFASARGGGDPATQVRGFRLYAAPDGAPISMSDTPVLVVANETGTRTAPVARSADLSGAPFQGIDSITFRYYPLTPATGNTMDFTGMTLNGAVVPEPSTAALGALVGLPLLLRRRRARPVA